MGTAVGWLPSAWRTPTAVVPTWRRWSGSAPSRSECSRAEPLPRASPFSFRRAWRRPPPRCCCSDGGCWLRGIRRRGLNIDQDRAAAATFDALIVPASPRRPQAATRSAGAAAGGVRWLPSPGAEPAKYCPAQTTRIEYVDDKGQWVQKDIGTGANEVIMNGELPGVEYLPGPPTGQAAPGTTDRLWPDERGNLVHEHHESASGPPKIEVLPRAGSVGRAHRDTRKQPATLAANRYEQVQRQQGEVRRARRSVTSAAAPPRSPRSGNVAGQQAIETGEETHMTQTPDPERARPLDAASVHSALSTRDLTQPPREDRTMTQPQEPAPAPTPTPEITFPQGPPESLQPFPMYPEVAPNPDGPFEVPQYPPYIPESQFDASQGMPRSTVDGVHGTTGDDPVRWSPSHPGELPPYWTKGLRARHRRPEPVVA